MNLSAFEIALIAGGFAIVGTLLGAWITYRLSEKLVQKNHTNAIELIHITEFNKAAIEFHCAFLEARQQLRDDPKANWFSILNSNVLLEHEKAAMRFKLFLTDKDKGCFDRDWNTYFSHRQHPGDRRPPEKRPEDWDDEDNCKIFTEQIEKLLSYAKVK